MTTKRSRSDQGEASATVQCDHSTDEPLTVVVAEAVASARDVDVIDLEPLHDVIDTDALERLFEPRVDGPRAHGSVTFEYQDCLVTVSAHGEIRVEPTS